MPQELSQQNYRHKNQDFLLSLRSIPNHIPTLVRTAEVLRNVYSVIGESIRPDKRLSLSSISSHTDQAKDVVTNTRMSNLHMTSLEYYPAYISHSIFFQLSRIISIPTSKSQLPCFSPGQRQWQTRNPHPPNEQSL